MDEDEPVCGETVDARYLALAVEAFAVLAHPDRLRLVLALGSDELSVNHLADIVEMSPISVQQHLSMLEFVGVVTSRRYEGRPFYGLADPHVRHLVLEHLPRADEGHSESGSATTVTRRA
jgi:DNA-binding transcriptional ArsR family regulator